MAATCYMPRPSFILAERLGRTGGPDERANGDGRGDSLCTGSFVRRRESTGTKDGCEYAGGLGQRRNYHHGRAGGDSQENGHIRRTTARRATQAAPTDG